MKTVLKLGRLGLFDQSGCPQSYWASLTRAFTHKAAGLVSLTRAVAHKATGPLWPVAHTATGPLWPEWSPTKLLGLSDQSGRPQSYWASLTRAVAHKATGPLWPEQSPTKLLGLSGQRGCPQNYWAGLSDQSSHPQSCMYAADFHSCVQNQQDTSTYTTSRASSVALPLERKTENIQLTWPVLAGFHKYPHHRRSRRVLSPGGTLLL